MWGGSSLSREGSIANQPASVADSTLELSPRRDPHNLGENVRSSNISKCGVLSALLEDAKDLGNTTSAGKVVRQLFELTVRGMTGPF